MLNMTEDIWFQYAVVQKQVKELKGNAAKGGKKKAILYLLWDNLSQYINFIF